jgi:uncharacterized protein YabN with tetrapyrrole methylase and pyrophosphatase domain
MVKLLEKLLAARQEAKAFGFEWANTDQLINQAISECAEIREAIEDKEPAHRVQEEIGDLLHIAISLCDFVGFDLEETLEKNCEKFDKRFNNLKTLAAERGLSSLEGKSLAFKLGLWDEIKKIEDT